MPTVLLASETSDMAFMCDAVAAVAPDLEIRVWPDIGHAQDIQAALVWFPPRGVLATLPNLKLIASIAAGTEHILRDPDLPAGVPVTRVVDPGGLTRGMVEYVRWNVVLYQRDLHLYLRDQRTARWVERPQRPPTAIPVGILGFGELGRACAVDLAALGYPVRCWSRTRKTDVPDGVTPFHGPDQFEPFVDGVEVLVCLIPLTAETANILDARVFDRMAPGSYLVQVGRGGHLVEADLLAALADGRLSGATLDVFRQEPLPAEHPFWTHPQILVTPHIASIAAPEEAARQMADNLRRVLAGAPPLNTVDPARGY